jgi:uncharacterized membrane protein YqiK
MIQTQQLVLVLIGAGAIILLGILVLFARCWRQVDQGQAMIINKMGTEPTVTFSGGIVLPIVHRAEVMDLSVKTIEISRRAKEGLICADNIRADIKVTFFVRINKTKDDVLRVAQSIGCARASQQSTIEELFSAKFSEALKTVGKKLEFEQLYTQRDVFKDQIIGVIGKDLNGYVLEDAAIDYLEQTPIEVLDPNNVLDALGIRKITAITTGAAIETNELKQRERMELGKQNLTSDEAVFRFEQQRAEAEAKKNKEIDIATARETNEANRFRLEEEKRTHVDRQRAEEAIQMAEQAKLRATQVAEQGRLREVEVEKVRVAKAHDLEEVGRKREVELGQIDAAKAIEAEKRSIADIVRARVAVEKTVAVEEEGIKDLRTDAEAKRTKQTAIVLAEGAAQEMFIKDIKKAEAEEQVARAQAKRQLTLAEAAMEAADKEARAAIRRAEGTQASLAEAAGKEANASAIEKTGLAEAVGLREKLLAEVAAKEAEAGAIEKRMLAEAKGLAEKATSMKALDGAAREHEEFRLRLQNEKEIAIESLHARVQMTEHQAEILAKAFEKANFNIVGGDGAFFERFVKAVSVGQSIDGVVDHSDVLKKVLGDRLNGNGSLIQDIKDVVASAGISSETLKNLSVTAVLARMVTDAGDDKTRSSLQVLLDSAKKLGLDKPAS